MIELQQFLRAAQRRLWLARSAMTFDRGLVIGNAVALLGVLWNLLIGAVPLTVLAAAVAAPCLAALLWSLVRRPTLDNAARWADDRCGGQEMFATGLEFLIQARRRGSPDALAALHARIGRALPAAAAQIAAERPPGTLRIALLTGTCVVLCGLGLRVPAARAGLRPAVSQARVPAAADLAAAPAADVGRAAERLRTALKESDPATAARSRQPTDAGEGGRQAAPRAAPVASAITPPANARRGDSTGDGGGREAGSSAAPPSAGPAADVAARFRAAFRDLATARNSEGAARAGQESLELEGRAPSSEAADFDARQRAEAPYALRAAAPREEPRAVESAAARAMLARYAALTTAIR